MEIQLILSHKTKELGVEKFSLNLNLLYPEKNNREKFETRWKQFRYCKR